MASLSLETFQIDSGLFRPGAKPMIDRVPSLTLHIAFGGGHLWRPQTESPTDRGAEVVTCVQLVCDLLTVTCLLACL